MLQYWTSALDLSTRAQYRASVPDLSSGHQYWTSASDLSTGPQLRASALDLSSRPQYLASVLGLSTEPQWCHRLIVAESWRVKVMVNVPQLKPRALKLEMLESPQESGGPAQ